MTGFQTTSDVDRASAVAPSVNAASAERCGVVGEWLSEAAGARRAHSVLAALPGVRPRGVVVWAAFGAAWVAFVTVGFARWIASDRFAAVGRGPDTISSTHIALIHGYEALATAIIAALACKHIVAPLLRRRPITLDGTILLAAAFAFFLDPVINLFHNDTFAWNAYAANMGSWGSFWPGHVGPHRYGEALLWADWDYINYSLLGALFGCTVLLRIRRWRPTLPAPAAFALLFAALAVVSAAVEIVRVRFELYSFARTWSGWTLWAGKPYQYPVYEALFTAAGSTAITYLRWSWLTNGRSFLDAGLEELAIGTAGKRAVLFLALCAYLALVWGALYFAPWALSSVSADSVAHLPSYMQPGR